MKFLSLFAGIGGFDLGLERAGMECVGQVEINEYCQKVLKKHWPNVKLMGDIKNVIGDEFGTVDLICGGFPCQPFSQSGKRKGKEDDRFLWPEMFRIIQKARPTWVIGENVSGFINMELESSINDLESIGYSVETLVIPACAVGLPHRRDRVWIVAYSMCIRLQSKIQKYGNRSELYEKRSSNTLGRLFTLLRFDLQRNSCHLRIDNGVPNWMDRIKSLGNAVVPQIPEIIGRAIIHIENDSND